MPKLSINGTEIDVAPGTSVLQACEQLGIEVPRFCYHDRLSVPANCRMCLVEIEKSPKPVASCAMPCGEGMVVKTDSDTVKKARHSVMEMLLINHPLDCPICDQGGECDLQDQAVGYGFDRGRYTEAKRAVEDKDVGPLIKTVMTRCIHCTRCIRFIDEVAGTPVLGGIGRGEHMEIDTFISQPITSEMSGNLVDVCPVGALTNKPYAFTARPWELTKTESIDVMDAVGSHIRIDTRGNEVMRILPRLNEDVNEEWINDKTRYALDGLKKKRLDAFYVRKGGQLQPVPWQEALQVVADKLKATAPHKIGALVGDMADAESMFVFKHLLDGMGVANRDCRTNGARGDVALAANVFHAGIAGIEQADALLLVGANPRYEATLINTRIRKRWLQGTLQVGLIGKPVDLTYAYTHVGASAASMDELLKGDGDFSQILQKAARPMLVVSAALYARPDAEALQAKLYELAQKYFVKPEWHGFNVIQQAASRVGGLVLGFVPSAGGMPAHAMVMAAGDGALDVVYAFGADDILPHQLGKAFVIYQGHHGDALAARADVVLPGAAYTEKTGTYVNTEGRVQQTRRAAFPPGEAREDWKIFVGISHALGQPLPFVTLADVRTAMVTQYSALSHVGEKMDVSWQAFGKAGPVDGAAFANPMTAEQFYMSNSICRASPTMHECVAMVRGESQKKVAA
ncbi:MAG: NADH-quinone oxidoreductase subunit G [Alphaproteobacteria bacterium]|nr:NADH-quinone oxidoreductase subunit G [Alphaproteobacteria bacterium]